MNSAAPSLPHFVHPTTGKQLRFGRNVPAGGLVEHPLLAKWSLFGTTKLPTPPSWFDYTRPSASSPALYSGMGDVLGNDEYSNCTSCAAVKILESWENRAGLTSTLGVGDALKFYGLSTGWNPVDPSTDRGGIETDVLGYWRDKGIDGNGAHKIAGYIPVHPKDVASIRSLCWLFGNLYFGVALPTSWTASPPQNGFLWTPASPNYQQGHCFAGLGADDQGILVVSWGLVGTITYDAVAQLCDSSNMGQLWCVCSAEDLAAARMAIPDIDWPTLVRDWDSQGGSIAA